MQVTRISEVTPQRNNGEMFTGEVHNHMLVDAPAAQALRLNLVKFSPGARTKWHSHTFEQGLIIVEGKGFVATEEAEHAVEPGDVVFVPMGEKHWHGGGETTGMAHIAINGAGESNIMEAVERIRSLG